MFGIGTAEVGVILVIVLLLFAPTVIAFLIGYTMGQRKGGSTPAATPSPDPPVPAAREGDAADE